MVAEPADTETPSERQFFHVHLMKTGGTVVNLMLRRQFDRSAIYPGPDDRSNPDVAVDLEQLLDVWPRRRHSVSVIAGHFPLSVTSLLDADLGTFTILRDPVERTLSMLRKQRMRLDDDDPTTLVDLYDDPFRFKTLVENHMVKMLALTPDEMTHGMMTPVDFEPRHLDTAMANLDGVDVVGLQTRLDEFVRDLDDAFGWDLGEVGRGNASDSVPAPDGLAERIAADNAFDMELYRYAVDLCEERRIARKHPVEGKLRR